MNISKFIRSIGHAFSGLMAVVKKEQNIKIELVIGLFVLLTSFLLRLSLTHFLIVLIIVFLIPGLEILNSMVEEVADLLQLEYEHTTYLRNLSAGLVLWFSLMAVVVGIIVFGQYL